MKIYLAGPINGCTDDEASTWREVIKGILGDENCIDPMKRDYRGVEDEAYREIVDLDKRDIDSADVVLVNYVQPSVGTSMEILWAWLRHTPVLVVCREGESLSPWLRYHSTAIVHTLKEAVDWLRKL